MLLLQLSTCLVSTHTAGPHPFALTNDEMHYEEEIMPQEHHQTRCCNTSVILFRYFDANSLIFTSFWLSLFTRASEHFYPAAGHQSTLILCEAVKEQH